LNEDLNRTEIIPQFFHIALTAVTAVDIGTLYAFVGGAVLSGNGNPTFNYMTLALPRLSQLFTGFEPRTLHVGHSSGLVGFVVDEVALA
jgi:hypothetical protein